MILLESIIIAVAIPFISYLFFFILLAATIRILELLNTLIEKKR